MKLHMIAFTLLTACLADPLAQEDSEIKIARPDVPAAIAVPEDQRVAFVGHAKGVQIYECAPDSGGVLTWRLRAPRAELIDASTDKTFATHFGGVDAGLTAGPYWKAIRDESWVRAGNAVSAPNPGAIPLLRLEVLDAGGKGIFGDVTFIHRLATVGGIGPAGACPVADERVEVPYVSDYYFYEPGLPGRS